jgi:insulin receptor
VGREKGRRYKNVTIGDGICQSIDIRNSVYFFSILKDCRVIEGFLQIVLIENNTEADFENVSFPELREITGYLLLYRVDGLKSLSKLFPNLEVIRGDILLTDYAFMIYEMKNLQEVRCSSRLSRRVFSFFFLRLIRLPRSFSSFSSPTRAFIHCRAYPFRQ